jgi:hypothetical protein
MINFTIINIIIINIIKKKYIYIYFTENTLVKILNTEQFINIYDFRKYIS